MSPHLCYAPSWTVHMVGHNIILSSSWTTKCNPPPVLCCLGRGRTVLPSIIQCFAQNQFKYRTWKIIFRIHSNFGKHFTCYSKMWSEKFSAVREIFFFQKGDLHNSFGRSVHVLGGLALLQRVQRTRHHAAPRRTTAVIACSPLLNKGCLNALESGCYAGGLRPLSWRAI